MEKMTSVGILYYTCNTHDLAIEIPVRKQLVNCKNGYELGCVSLKPTEFGDWWIDLDLERSPLSMHKQVMIGIGRMESDIVFLVESDVLYHKSHFDFIPERSDVFYYNTNCWKVRYPDGHAVWTDNLQQVSGCCARRELLLDFYRERVKFIEKNGFDRHYEPGPKTGRANVENWQSTYPNLDIRHDHTLTKSKWSPDEFRNPIYAKGWKEASEVPGWGRVEGNLMELLSGV
jgi:hypothetical protein